MRSFAGRDILSLKEFERDEYYRVFDACDTLAPIPKSRKNVDLCKDKTLVTAFYQPSTRTRLAHEGAMHRLGGHVTGFSDAKMTRAGDFYQESIKDTVHMLEYYGDVIAMRHFQQGAPAEAASFSSVPVINCGDGWGEHPTQILTDLYTLKNELGKLDGTRIMCVGDMRMRTMHSIGYASTQFDITLDLVHPPDMGPTKEWEEFITKKGGRINKWKSVEECIDKCDACVIEPVVQADYTKARQEADAKKGLTPVEYKVTKELLAKKAKSGFVVLHSLPRMDELPMDVDDTRHARYWIEAFNGVVCRMALLALTLGKLE